MFKSQLTQLKMPIDQSHSSPSKMDRKHSQDLIQLGNYGEILAQNYLENNGYLTEAKNWRGQRGELDLVVRRKRTLVIVEVRTTSTLSHESYWMRWKCPCTPYLHLTGWDHAFCCDMWGSGVDLLIKYVTLQTYL